MNDVLDSKLCALIRREAERLGKERGRRGFEAEEVANAALIEAMTIASGTTAQVRARLIALVDEALRGPMCAEPQEPPPGASEDDRLAYAEALRAQGAAMLAEADAMKRVLKEAKRRGLKPGAPVSSVFTKEEFEAMMSGRRWGVRKHR